MARIDVNWSALRHPTMQRIHREAKYNEFTSLSGREMIKPKYMRWRMVVEWDDIHMRKSDIKELRRISAALVNRSNYIVIPIYNNHDPVTKQPMRATGARTNRTIRIDFNGTLEAGRMISIDGRMYTVTETTTGTGPTNVGVLEPIRSAPPANADVKYGKNVEVRMRLDTDAAQESAGLHSSFRFDLVEPLA